jgi:hypothetical protein
MQLFLPVCNDDAVTLLNRGIQPAVLDAISGIVRTDLAVQVYLSGNVLNAASATVAVNLGIEVMLIAIPSFLVPLSASCSR